MAVPREENHFMILIAHKKRRSPAALTALFTAIFCIYAVSPLYFSFSLDDAGKAGFDATEDGAVSKGLVLVKLIASSFGGDDGAVAQDIGAPNDDDDDGMVLARKRRAIAPAKQQIKPPTRVAATIPLANETQTWQPREPGTPQLKVRAQSGYHYAHSGMSPPSSSVRV